ncbi:M35 family metallo-endopeptidase [Variovorax ureilyticus]|uniref:M35 family metallo-endopeptidase n=1 Tax=Variovorax ureilyticus TaxID=1836198 RepID=A0ABU8V9C1_9BURK
MERKYVVVGDPPANGGRILPYVGREFTIHGHQVALIGGRAYCQACRTIGVIAKAGGARRLQFISEAALEGDVVVCECPFPQPLIATLQHTSTFDDMAGGSAAFDANTLARGWFQHDSQAIASSKMLVDSQVKHPHESADDEDICPNMSNEQFVELILKLRDKAVELISQRVRDLERWGSPEKQRVKTWFGASDGELRQYLSNGLKACIRVLEGLTGDNFVRYSESAMRNVGCTPSGNQSGAGLAAEVCGPDLKTRTIGIGLEFCTLPDISFSIDSKLGTLIHEVTHFVDTFSSVDTVYHMREALKWMPENPSKARTNVDSITGYVMYGN